MAYFNSRPRMRANRRGRSCAGCGARFQLPPSHEGEQRRRVFFSLRMYFNSRPRMRANARNGAKPGRRHNFNSRPRMRANAVPSLTFLAAVFQLPPSHEGEQWLAWRSCAASKFQLPPSHEGELRPKQSGGTPLHFNSRPRMRANKKSGGNNNGRDISTPALA